MADLLPPNATTLERNLAATCAQRANLPVAVRTLYQPAACPSALLPWMAWQFGVDGWELAESEDARRALYKGAIPLHMRKGTPWAVREVIRRLGFGEVTIVEGRRIRRRDGSCTRNGDYVHGRRGAWAEYIVKLSHPITRDQADHLRIAIERYAPARSHLVALDYTAAPIRHNGMALRNGQYNRGSVKA
ncbi:phage tail protein I [Ralstonia solanacearum]|nr:phage tail protein I [Ralstonia solanacearum]